MTPHMDRNRLSLVGTTVAAASVGFLAGVLAAPRSGRRTRRRLGRRLEGQRDEWVRRGRHAASDLAGDVGGRFEDARQAVSDAAEELSERLEDARDAAAHAFRR